MAFEEHLDLTWTGVFGSRALPAEIWSFGVSADLGVQGPNRDLLEDNAEALSDAWVQLEPGITNNTFLTEFTVALVGTDGRIPRDLSGAFIQGKHEEDAQDGTNAGLKAPLQIALVHSLHSVVSGPTGRGRFYLPGVAMGTLELDGRMSVSVRGAFAARLQAFVNALNVTLGTMAQGPVAIASQGSVSQGIAPANNAVVTTSVGRVLDTQRRRRGDLDEEREFLPITL